MIPGDSEPAELNSSACSMTEADDRYMGYAGREEMLAFFNMLLEAERAGARVALETRAVATESELEILMDEVAGDEARWCAMLLREIEFLGGVPSSRTGTFYDKAMAVADVRERVALLNRGQRWVSRKLAAFLPRVRNDGLHRALLEMKQAHDANATRVDGVIDKAR